MNKFVRKEEFVELQKAIRDGQEKIFEGKYFKGKFNHMDIMNLLHNYERYLTKLKILENTHPYIKGLKGEVKKVKRNQAYIIGELEKVVKLYDKGIIK